MAYVIGPNGVRTYVPDDMARSLVGDGDSGYIFAPEPTPEPEADKPKAPARRATTRRKPTT